jgi:biopolymer transport protein ExbD
MLDVCFLLLVFFVVTANFAMNEGVLPADLPQGIGDEQRRQEMPPQLVRIVVDPVGIDGATIWLEGVGRVGNVEQLYRLLNGARFDEQRNPNGLYDVRQTVIVIRAHAEVCWSHVVDVFNAAVRARYTNIRFARGKTNPNPFNPV